VVVPLSIVASSVQVTWYERPTGGPSRETHPVQRRVP
jgi:hypothetical protein